MMRTRVRSFGPPTAAGVHDLIVNLPQGYQTAVRPNGG